MPFQLPENWSEHLGIALRLTIVITVSLLLYLIIARMLRSSVRRGSLSAPVRNIIRNLVRWLLLLVTLFVLLGELGLLQNVWAAIVAVLAVTAVGFVAVWSVMSNVLCTLLLLVVRPFRIGDTVEFPSESLGGRVINLNFLFTTLQEEDQGLIQIPNNYFFQKPIRRRRVDPKITLWEQLNTDDDAS